MRLRCFWVHICRREERSPNTEPELPCSSDLRSQVIVSTGKLVRETGVACVCCCISLISVSQGQIWVEIEVLYRRCVCVWGALSRIWYEICMPRDHHWLNKVKKGSMEIGETDTDSVHKKLRLLGWLGLGNPGIVGTRELWATSPWVLKSREEEGIRAVFIFVSR